MEITDAIEFNLRKKLKAWLEKSDWTIDELLNWLQGFELPAVGYDDEPYVWILRGLPLADERHQAERELARRLSSFLSQQPDVKPSNIVTNEALYNVLMLCAELQCRDELAESLYQVFTRRHLSGKWRGVELREALVSALIYNQLDDRLEPVWEDMLDQGHDFLPGDANCAFAGILYKPKSELTRGEPDLDAIGATLARMAQCLESQKNGQVEFLRLIDWVKNAYPRSQTLWMKDLIEQAHKYDWTPWGIVRLDLVCALDTIPGEDADGYYYYIWDAYYPFLDQVSKNTARDHGKHNVKKMDSMCKGKILKVSVSSDTQELLMALTFRAEMERRKACAEFSSYDTLYKITCATFNDTAFTYLENSKSNNEEIDTIVRASQNAAIYSLGKVYPKGARKLKAIAARLGGTPY